MKLSRSIPWGRWRRLLLWCTGAFPLARAKVDLELVLRLERPAKVRFGPDSRGGVGTGGSHGASVIGGGY